MNAIGQPVSRVDGPAKVTGKATYAAEFDLPGLVHAAMVQSTIAKGRIARIDTADAARAPGVLAVLTHENAPKLPYDQMEERPQVDTKSGEQLHVLQGPEIAFNGHPVAVVVARTLEQASHAAELVSVAYESAPADTTFDLARAHSPAEATIQSGRPANAGRGDPEHAMERAPVRISAQYQHPREHHNAIEPHVTIAHWEGDHLTLYDKTQWVDNDRKEIAHVFGMPEERIRVVSPFVGGAFGSALRTWPHVTLAALAAKVVGRPVRLELTRRQLYSSVGYRPHTLQHVALGAGQDGRLTSVIHEVVQQAARYEEYAETALSPTLHLYSCPDLGARYRLVDMDVNSPCPMRAPGVVSGVLGIEMAMDELAVALGMDPVELRLKNFAGRDENKNLPWSSNELRACYRMAAERFGWERRDAAPGSMRDGRIRIGYGMATAIYHSDRSAGSASVAITGNGTAVARSASSDMGPGTYTSMTQVAAEVLGLPVEDVRFELGDTNLPLAPVHGGSITMASIGNAVAAAARAVQAKLVELARAATEGPFAGLEADQVLCRDGGLARADGGPVVPYSEVLRHHHLGWIEAEAKAGPGEETEKYSSAAFGAVFVEVRVDPDLGTVRVQRMVGAYDVGRVINPKIARSQCIGGMVGGLGMALEERAEWDPRFGRVMNANLAEYVVPVCADIGDLDVIFVPGDDRNFNPLGVKGLAEVAICGVAPAIANAVFHATGRRIRDFPITPDRLLGGEA